MSNHKLVSIRLLKEILNELDEADIENLKSLLQTDNEHIIPKDLKRLDLDSLGEDELEFLESIGIVVSKDTSTIKEGKEFKPSDKVAGIKKKPKKNTVYGLLEVVPDFDKILATKPQDIVEAHRIKELNVSDVNSLSQEEKDLLFSLGLVRFKIEDILPSIKSHKTFEENLSNLSEEDRVKLAKLLGFENLSYENIRDLNLEILDPNLLNTLKSANLINFTQVINDLDYISENIPKLSNDINSASFEMSNATKSGKILQDKIAILEREKGWRVVGFVEHEKNKSQYIMIYDTLAPVESKQGVIHLERKRFEVNLTEYLTTVRELEKEGKFAPTIDKLAFTKSLIEEQILPYHKIGLDIFQQPARPKLVFDEFNLYDTKISYNLRRFVIRYMKNIIYELKGYEKISQKASLSNVKSTVYEQEYTPKISLNKYFAQRYWEWLILQKEAEQVAILKEDEELRILAQKVYAMDPSYVISQIDPAIYGLNPIASETENQLNSKLMKYILQKPNLTDVEAFIVTELQSKFNFSNFEKTCRDFSIELIERMTNFNLNRLMEGAMQNSEIVTELQQKFKSAKSDEQRREISHNLLLQDLVNLCSISPEEMFQYFFFLTKDSVLSTNLTQFREGMCTSDTMDELYSNIYNIVSISFFTIELSRMIESYVYSNLSLKRSYDSVLNDLAVKKYRESVEVEDLDRLPKDEENLDLWNNYYKLYKESHRLFEKESKNIIKKGEYIDDTLKNLATELKSRTQKYGKKLISLLKAGTNIDKYEFLRLFSQFSNDIRKPNLPEELELRNKIITNIPTDISTENQKIENSQLPSFVTEKTLKQFIVNHPDVFADYVANVDIGKYYLEKMESLSTKEKYQVRDVAQLDMLERMVYRSSTKNVESYIYKIASIFEYLDNSTSLGKIAYYFREKVKTGEFEIHNLYKWDTPSKLPEVFLNPQLTRSEFVDIFRHIKFLTTNYTEGILKMYLGPNIIKDITIHPLLKVGDTSGIKLDDYLTNIHHRCNADTGSGMTTVGYTEMMDLLVDRYSDEDLLRIIKVRGDLTPFESLVDILSTPYDLDTIKKRVSADLYNHPEMVHKPKIRGRMTGELNEIRGYLIEMDEELTEPIPLDKMIICYDSDSKKFTCHDLRDIISEVANDQPNPFTGKPYNKMTVKKIRSRYDYLVERYTKNPRAIPPKEQIEQFSKLSTLKVQEEGKVYRGVGNISPLGKNLKVGLWTLYDGDNIYAKGSYTFHRDPAEYDKDSMRVDYSLSNFKVGLWRYYDEIGEVVKTIMYDSRGNIVGLESDSGSIVSNERTGDWVEKKDGNIIESGKYRNGKKSGWWYERVGDKWQQGRYKSGKRVAGSWFETKLDGKFVKNLK